MAIQRYLGLTTIAGAWLTALSVLLPIGPIAAQTGPALAPPATALRMPAPDSQPYVAGEPPVEEPLAWAVADDALYRLDRDLRVRRLDPASLAEMAASSPLAGADPAGAGTLLVDGHHLIAAGSALSQTVIMDRATLEPQATLAPGFALATDPGRTLYVLAGSYGARGPWREQVVAYDLTDLQQPPTVLQTYQVMPEQRLAAIGVDPVQRRMFLQWHLRCGGNVAARVDVFDLDSQKQLDSLNFVAGRGCGQMDVPLWDPAHARYVVNSRSAIVNDLETLFVFDPELAEFTEVPGRTAVPGGLAIDAQGDYLQLLRNRGLWIVDADDFSLVGLLPFTAAPPKTLLLDPGGERIYLLGNGWQSRLPIADLVAAGIPSLPELPAAWGETGVWGTPRYDLAAIGLPGAAFVDFQDQGVSELYRRGEGGGWSLIPAISNRLGEKVHTLSFSPDFARDGTVVAALTVSLTAALRSTDGGVTWRPWTPPVMAFASDRGGNQDIYIMAASGRAQRLTDDPGVDQTPAWSPGWTRVAFASDRTGNWEIYSVRADCNLRSAGAVRRCDLRQLTSSPADDLLPAWSPDGRWIAFVSLRDGNPEIYLMRPDGSDLRRLTDDPAGDWRPAWAPDGLHLYFTSDRAGSNDIYRMAYDPVTTTTITTVQYASPGDDRDPSVGDLGLYFLSDQEGGEWQVFQGMADGGEWRYTLEEAPGILGHPSWGLGSPNLLVSLEMAGVTNIYRYEPERTAAERAYGPVTVGAGFDGHPAAGPVPWEPPRTGEYWR
jgi:hypothetical protein